MHTFISDIVSDSCLTQNGGITAAQAALDAEINGYSDWYLPSKDELVEMYFTIGNGSLEGNIGEFELNPSWPYYWSSSESFVANAWVIFSTNGNSNSKYDENYVRPIRSF